MQRQQQTAIVVGGSSLPTNCLPSVVNSMAEASPAQLLIGHLGANGKLTEQLESSEFCQRRNVRIKSKRISFKWNGVL